MVLRYKLARAAAIVIGIAMICLTPVSFNNPVSAMESRYTGGAVVFGSHQQRRPNLKVSEQANPGEPDLANDILPLPEVFLKAQATTESKRENNVVKPITVVFGQGNSSYPDQQNQVRDQANQLLSRVNQWFKTQFNGAGLTIESIEVVMVGTEEFLDWKVETREELWESLLGHLIIRDSRLANPGRLTPIFVADKGSAIIQVPKIYVANKGIVMMSLEEAGFTGGEESKQQAEELQQIVLAHLLSHALGLEHSGQPGIIYTYFGDPSQVPPPIDDIRAFTEGVPTADWRREITSPNILQHARKLSEAHFSPFPKPLGSEMVQVLRSGFVTPERSIGNCQPLPDPIQDPVVITANSEKTKICFGFYQVDRQSVDPIVVIRGSGVVDLGGATILDPKPNIGGTVLKPSPNNGGVILGIEGDNITVKNGILRGGWLGIYAKDVARPILDQVIAFDQRRMANLIETGDYGDSSDWLDFGLSPEDHLAPFSNQRGQLAWYNYGAGVVFEGVSQGEITNSLFTHQDIGAAVYGGSAKVANNYFIDNYWGVRHWKPEKLEVFDNVFKGDFKYERWWRYAGDAAAIVGPFTLDTEIARNAFVVSADGVFSSGTNGIAYLGGTLNVHDNTFYLTTAHGVEHTLDRFRGIHPNQRAKMHQDLVVINLGGLRVTGNEFVWPWCSGIWAGGSHSALVVNNTFTGANSLTSPFGDEAAGAAGNPFGDWSDDQGGISAERAFGLDAFANRVLFPTIIGANLNGGVWDDWRSFYSGAGQHVFVENEFGGNRIVSSQFFGVE
jgi:hypothetical protein